MSNASATPSIQKLTLPMLTSLVVGNMVGTGIFMLPASLSAFGTISIFSWIFTGIGALFLALTFANLNKKLPQSGGAYIYCKEAYGDFVGFVVAYMYWISLWVCTAGVAVASIGYLDVILRGISETAQTAYHPWMTFAIEVAAVWIFTLINVLGVRSAGLVQLILTVLKILPLLLISVIGFFKIDLSNLTQFNISGTSNFSAVTSAATLTLWAFIGLESATIPAENASSTRDVYRATVYGTLITAAIYIVSTVVLMGIVPPEVLKSSSFPFASAASVLFGHNMAFVVAICAIVSGLGTLSVGILIQGQVPYVAARDNMFPKVFGKKSKFGTPLISQFISSGLVTVLLLFTVDTKLVSQFNTIALLATLATLATYFMCTISELRLLYRNPEQCNRRTLVKSAIIAVLAAGYTFWMMIGAGKETILLGLVLLATCLPVYAWVKMRRKAVITVENAQVELAEPVYESQ